MEVEDVVITVVLQGVVELGAENVVGNGGAEYDAGKLVL